MKLNKIISIILLFLLVSMTAFGQSRTIRRGNTFFERGEYFKALEYYTEAQSDGEELSIEVRSRIAQCQYHLKDIDAAFNLFREIEDQLEGQDLFIYASTTHAFGYYEGAIELYRQCLEQGIGNASQIQELIKSCEWAIENRDIRIDFLVNPSELLTFGQSFGIQYYKDGVVYSSSSGEGNEVDRYGKEFLNLYYSRLEDGEIQDQRLFSENLVFDYHVGAISFTSDEETMYYTKSVRVRGGDSRIKIFRVTYDGNEWGNEEELSINSDNYDCAYPAVTPDDKYLIFASNMKGGFGGTDLYIAERFGNGRFGSPKNLGPNINSFGYERFPFVSDQYDLYFASDGHMGFGGLDIFKATSLGEGEWGDVENMMQFINSSKDDFGYVIDPDNPKRGFLSSNRLGSGQEDVIFYVEPLSSKEDTSVEGEEEGAKEDDSMLMGGLIFNNQPKSEDADEPEPEPEPEVDVSMFPDALSTTVNSTFNGTAIDGANIVVEDVATGQVVVEGTTDRNGKVHLILPDEYRKQDQSFKISINKGDDYLGKNMIVDIMELEDIARNGVSLTPEFDDVELDDIGTMIIPYRGESITSEGQEVLDKLAVYLENNPNVVIKLNAHTDARGNKYNNLQVSQNVAEKAKEYLMKKGIDDKNVIPRGYGERYLINKCKRGKYCEESMHLENRRVEVVVWRMLN